MEFVLTGVVALAGSAFMEDVDAWAETGAEPVCVCVGGFWRYGMKERTLCSATAGEMLDHHCANPALYPRGKYVGFPAPTPFAFAFARCEASIGFWPESDAVSDLLADIVADGLLSVFEK